MEFLWLLFMMIGILARTGMSQGCTPPPGAQNLALGRPATQSSTLPSGVAEKAVDGKRDGKWEQGSCSHTQLDTEPWWIVDLGSRQSVSAVIVKNREDECCGERIRGAQIRVGDSVIDHGKHNPICGTITDTRPGSVTTICCNGLEGRFVTIVIPGRAEYLTLCEVEVLDRGCAPPPGAQNLALGRPATQSSTLPSGVAEKAVDGKRDGKWEQRSCSHTQFDTEPWWTVDLGSPQSVSAVIVKNREDACCGERIRGAQIRVGDSLIDQGKQNPIWLLLFFSCGTITDTRPGSVSTICCNGLEGRYVTIVIPGRAEYLTLCEVEVIAQGCTPPPGAQNLALGRPATQSSTFENKETGKAVAEKAVDGKRDGKWVQGSCSHTQFDTEPWWTVDLGSRQSVSAVIVKNREDECCGERIRGAQIHVGDSLADNGKQNPISCPGPTNFNRSILLWSPVLCAQSNKLTNPTSDSPVLPNRSLSLWSSVLCSCGTITDTRPGSVSTICCYGLEGRYVTIVIPGRAEYLTLCEVEVLAQGCAPPPGARNLALGRPATQSSTYVDNDRTGNAVAGKAVDGKRDGKWVQGSCSHTQFDTEPWWTVDLGSRQSVSAVIVKNREDECCGERIRGAQIRVGDSLADHGKQNPICGTITDTRPGSVSTICCYGLEGRYVTIVIPGRAEYLTLCEVEVIAHGCAPPPGGKELAQRTKVGTGTSSGQQVQAGQEEIPLEAGTAHASFSSSPEDELMLKGSSPPQDDLRAHQDLLNRVASHLGLQAEVVREMSVVSWTF
ncbi:uncharacterized protein LOC117871842 [Trachemys scripta elegans]|uniref:uncharacterized protein LOC117871842 n=1 Tax=Trachemys scripta elegans TaxID=31138 RepID=UPI001557BDCB|nr:uncharacterized protein LOC117871842 [Trachemys scripta elegans]